MGICYTILILGGKQMDEKALRVKIKEVQVDLNKVDEKVKRKIFQEFLLKYTHHSMAIENNTLTLEETKAILNNGTVMTAKDNREVNEIINHRQAFIYVRECLLAKEPLTEKIIKEMHRLLMENIMVGGVYRTINVFIPGAKYTPLPPNDVQLALKRFYHKIVDEGIDPLSLAAYTHTEILKIHPFIDGNGRIARLLMNYQLMGHGFLPINIKCAERAEYYNLINDYAHSGELEPFVNFIVRHQKEELEQLTALIKISTEIK